MLTRQPFWFLRHGQTDWNRTGRCQGRKDVPLSMQGEAEAHAAIPQLKHLGINAICCSPLKRARHTAEIIARGLALPVADVPGLEEMDVGPYEGVADYSWIAPWREDKPVDGIEPFPELRKRVAWAANRALGTASHVLIVAHGGVFWALQHLCRSPFTPLAHCRPAHLSPVGEAAWRIEMLTLGQAGDA
ncbi:MAG TPA: histidine phosphatase family protein [Dongiaceae bacterium]|jgi:probable phosphoglycerate mutase|nr:histidine phosphatase family protein [Dongiaceae bacterium]